MNWKFYKPLRNKLKDNRDFFINKLLDEKRKKININYKNIKRILFMRIDGKIGDYIISSFIFKELKKNNPNIIIDIVSDTSIKKLLETNKNIDNVYVYKRKNTFQMLKMIKKLKKNKYDVLVDLTEHMKYKEFWFVKSMKAEVNIGYDKEDFNIFNIKIEKNNNKMIENYKEILKKLGITDFNFKYEVPISLEYEKEIEKYFEDKKLGSNVIAINFFGYSKGRKINKENILKILELLRKKEYKTIILDSPRDRKILEEIMSEIQDKNIFYKKTESIMEAISIIKRCDLIISPDTSIVHIAEGLDKKIIAFYDEEKVEKWGINRTKNNILIEYNEDINELDYEKELGKYL